MDVTATNIAAIYIAAAICIGVILGLIARSKGGSLGKWFIYGALLPVIALPHAIIIIQASGSKQCMYCHKKVKYTATHCPKCGYEFIDLS
ncbi:MAG: zinc ribbon domain-containing protein [Thermodesulfobacteriota bacterium]